MKDDIYIFWLVLKHEISYRVINILKYFWFLLEDFLEDLLYFCIVKVFHISSFALKTLFNVNGQGHSVAHPLFT